MSFSLIKYLQIENNAENLGILKEKAMKLLLQSPYPIPRIAMNKLENLTHKNGPHCGPFDYT